MLDYHQFSRLWDPLATRPFRLDTQEGEWLTTKGAWELAKGQLTLDEPLRMPARTGGRATDLLWSELVPLVCIS